MKLPIHMIPNCCEKIFFGEISKHCHHSIRLALAIAFVTGSFFGPADITAQAGSNQPPASKGLRVLKHPSGMVDLKMLVERDSIEIGELGLAVAYGKGAAHSHGSDEYIYVTAGELGLTFTATGKLHVLKPGMVGFIKKGETVIHTVLSKDPVKALIIWRPGGEADKLVELGFKSVPIAK